MYRTEREIPIKGLLTGKGGKNRHEKISRMEPEK